MKRPPRVARFLMLGVLAVVEVTCAAGPRAKASDVFADPRVIALAEAAAAGDAKRVAQLAAEGVDVNARGDKGVNLLLWALLNRSRGGLSALLDAHADPARADHEGMTVVHYAAMANDPGYLKILLAKGASPDTPHGVTREVPLVSAMMAEREEQFDMLMKAGADPKRVDRTDNTPLHVAAKINNFREVLLLLEAGAPPEARNRQGVTFQRYLFMTPERVLSADSKRSLRKIVAWLESHNIPVETAEEPARPR